MKLKVNLLIIITVVITVYIIFLGVKVCREGFVTDDVTNPNILKSTDVDLSNYYQTITKNALDNVDPNKADAIGDANIPYSQNIYDKPMAERNIYEYEVISVYKKVLDRNPNQDELEKAAKQFADGEMDEELLRTYLLNSTEYSMNVKVQSNSVNEDIEYRYAKEDLLLMISKMYFQELRTEAPKRMLLPLRDVFMLLENDKYLFRAFLIHDKYKQFENEILESKMLKKENILQIFEKYFNMNEIRLKANDIKRYDALNRVSTSAQPPASVPANTGFQGASLTAVNSGDLGAGSGAGQPSLQQILANL
jgi:hypothetical protein